MRAKYQGDKIKITKNIFKVRLINVCLFDISIKLEKNTGKICSKKSKNQTPQNHKFKISKSKSSQIPRMQKQNLKNPKSQIEKFQSPNAYSHKHVCLSTSSGEGGEAEVPKRKNELWGRCHWHFTFLHFPLSVLSLVLLAMTCSHSEGGHFIGKRSSTPGQFTHPLDAL